MNGRPSRVTLIDPLTPREDWAYLEGSVLRRRFRAFEDFCLNVGAGVQALPEAFRLLRGCVDSDHAALFQCDLGGRMHGAFHEIAGHAPQALDFIDRARHGTDAIRRGDPPSVAELFAARVPMQLLRFDDEASRASALYRDVIGPIGGSEVLRIGLCAPGEAPLGVVALVRGKGRGFSEADTHDLLALARPWRRLVQRMEAERLELVGEGFVMVSAEGTLERTDPSGRRLWNNMCDARFLPAFDADALLREIREGRAHAWRFELGPGTFELESIALEPMRPEPTRPEPRASGRGSTLLRIRQLAAPRVRQLMEMDRHGLSSMQKMVCLDLLHGRTAAEIAVEHGIAVRTAISHTRDLYRKLDVADRSELVAKLERPHRLA